MRFFRDKYLCILKNILCLIVVSGFPLITYAVEVRPNIPSTVEPERVSQSISAQQPTEQPTATAPISNPSEKPASPLGEEAEKIKFKLTKIILQDNRVYTEQQLEPIYKDKLNKTISVAELQDIVQNITNYYRNNGYILSRAILPPQHVKNGVVEVRILEGFIDQVNVIGNPDGAKNLLIKYGNKISESRPTQLKTMERYLLLSNEVPGAQVKAILEPSKKTTAASDLNLSTEMKKYSGYFSYDSYGTRYIGPLQVTAGLEADSMVRAGDASHLTLVRTTKGNELQYYDVSHETPLGSNGARISLGTNDAKTNPLFTLSDVDIAGDSQTVYSNFKYPIIRSREKILTFNAGFNYLDSKVTTFDAPLYTDHIRSVKAGFNTSFSDRFYGNNNFDLMLGQGLNILGATNNSTSTTTSRFGGQETFTKITFQANRSQLIHGRYSAFGTLQTQYSFVPLLASEQFGVGGSQLGRAYDPAEIIGDRGVAGSLELRMDTHPGKFLLHDAQFYLFYDGGVVWNMKAVANTKQKQSITSTGAGIRIVLMNYLSGNIMIAQPLTKQIASLEQINTGRRPRILFSLTAVL